MDLSTATAADFEPFIGQTFSLAGSEDHELSLEQVDILARQPESPREPFALVFKGEHAEPLPQQLYELLHDDTGALQIFLVPVGQDGNRFVYEAVFN